MNIKNFFYLLAITFCFAAPLFALPGEYSVSSGDTLWNLAGRYYNNPCKWTTIYEANKQTINNPHWIYPEQKIEIPGMTIASAAPLPAQETMSKEITAGTTAPAEFATEANEPKIEIVEPVKVEQQVEASEAKESTSAALTDNEKNVGDTFIVEGKFKYDGRIVGVKEEKTLMAQGDIVYINLGSDNGLTKGMRCYVFRKKGKIRIPGTGSTVGTQVVRVGILKISSEINKNSATAMVLRSFEPIIIGDYVKIIK